MQTREVFADALSELVLKQPEEPLEFLIKYLQKRNKFQIYSIIGYPEQARINLVEDLAAEFNLKVVVVNNMEENRQEY